MANTFELISSYTATGSVASISFASIPATFTDLCIKVSVRGSNNIGTASLRLRYNSATTNFTNRRIDGSGSSVDSSSGSDGAIAILQGGDATANTFGNYDIYIPNYAGSNYKSASSDTVNENNAATEYATLYAHLWSQTTAISSIELTPSAGTLSIYSSAYLYGIKNS